jgi:hypothetical protein
MNVWKGSPWLRDVDGLNINEVEGKGAGDYRTPGMACQSTPLQNTYYYDACNSEVCAATPKPKVSRAYAGRKSDLDLLPDAGEDPRVYVLDSLTRISSVILVTDSRNIWDSDRIGTKIISCTAHVTQNVAVQYHLIIVMICSMDHFPLRVPVFNP